MRTIIVINSLFLFCYTGLIYGQDKKTEERLPLLKNAIGFKDDALMRNRALSELSSIAKENELAQGILIERLLAGDISYIYDEVAILSSGDERIARKVRDLCIESESDIVKSKQKLSNALFLWGRMGNKAKDIIPFLEQQLQKYQTDPVMESRIRIALANAGYKSQENMNIILSDLKQRTPRGCEEIAQLARCGAGPWITDEIINEMVKWLGSCDKQGAETIGDLAMALASLGTRARSADKYLKNNLENDAYLYGSPLVIIIGSIALAKVDPSEFDNALQKIFKCLSPTVDYGGHGASYTVYISNYLFDTNMIDRVAKYLEDQDENIVASATYLLRNLSEIHSEAKRFKSSVLNKLKMCPSEDIRADIAISLSILADPVDIQVLQEYFRNEQSVMVRFRILETIRIIQLKKPGEMGGNTKAR
jgi:HEAT repeat protein